MVLCFFALYNYIAELLICFNAKNGGGKPDIFTREPFSAAESTSDYVVVVLVVLES